VLDDVPGIIEGGEPVKSGPKSLGHEGSTAGVVPIGSFVDFSKESNPIFLRYAPLEHPYGAPFVEFPVDYREGLGAPHDLSAMDGIFW
jgi:hypothetical protein